MPPIEWAEAGVVLASEATATKTRRQITFRAFDCMMFFWARPVDTFTGRPFLFELRFCYFIILAGRCANGGVLGRQGAPFKLTAQALSID